MFGLLSSGVAMKAASAEQEAASTVASVDTLNLNLTCSIVFVRHNDVHIQQFSIDTKLSKKAFEKSVLSIVAYGVCLTCITSIAFTMKARYTNVHVVCLQ